MSITLPSLGNNMTLQIDTSINIILGTSTYKHKWKMNKDKWKMIKHKLKMVRERLNLDYFYVMAL